MHPEWASRYCNFTPAIRITAAHSPSHSMTSPLLRSPPFPWVSPRRAAVSLRARDNARAPQPAERLTALARAITAARVGGTFWGTRPELPGRPFRLLDAAEGDGFRLAAGDDPWPAILAAEEIVAEKGSEVGALAAIAGKPVRYPGGKAWPAREQMVRAHVLGSVRYRDPFSGGAVAGEEAIATLALWRSLFDINRCIGRTGGMAVWKRKAIGRFLFDGLAAPVHGRTGGPGGRAVWPSRCQPQQGDWQVEDGFLRSVGLGAELRSPWSIVVDSTGIYYDPEAPSDLETLLETGAFDAELTERAALLREAIIAAGIAKYGARGEPVSLPTGRRLILVPGQVEDDRSVRLGGGRLQSNAALLKAVRETERDAHIVFKPHPDVEAGLRTGGPSPAEADRLADTVVRGASLGSLFEQVDEVHTLTSLTGFEALLRGIAVTTYGAPFYAGWGLTTDRGAIPARRTKRRTLDELVAAALILYPRYLDPETQLPCAPETIVERFAAHEPRSSPLFRLRQAQGQARLRLRKAG